MDVRRFPDGYEVKVYRKKDIMKTVNQNIIDQDIALEIIEQCEIAANNYLKQGRWAGIPFMGSVKISEHYLVNNTLERKELINEARDFLDKDKYVLFRRKLHFEDSQRFKYNKYYKYVTAMTINKNKKVYKELCKTHGEAYANLYMFAIANITAIDNEYEILNYEE